MATGRAREPGPARSAIHRRTAGPVGSVQDDRERVTPDGQARIETRRGQRGRDDSLRSMKVSSRPLYGPCIE